MTEPEKISRRMRKLFEQLRGTPPRDARSAALGRANYMAKIEALNAPKIKAGRAGFRKPNVLRREPRLAWVVGSLLLSLVLLVTGTGVAFASQSALPSDGLYPVKLAIEDLQLALSTDDAYDVQLLLKFSQRRVDEMARLVEEGRYADLSIPVRLYNDQLLEIASIITTYQEEDDPQAEGLISSLRETLSSQETLLSGLVETAPELASEEIESAVTTTQDIAERHEDNEGEQAGEARIKDIEPDRGAQGQVLRVRIEGENTHFGPDSRVSFEPASGINVLDISFNGATVLLIQLSIDFDAVLGERTVLVRSGDEVAAGETFRVAAVEEDEEVDGVDEEEEISGEAGDSDEDSTEEAAEEGESGGGEDEGSDGNGDGDEQEEEVRFSGQVQSISGQSWTINGNIVTITSETEIKDSINVGDEVEVRAHELPDGSLLAERIELVD